MATPTGTFVSLVGSDPLVQSLVGGLVIALLNALGAAAIVFVRNPSERALDALMGFAAGGMLFVISHEIVPRTHSRGNEHVATMGLMIGLAVMLTLDVVLA
jgi:ZIP family zinc transporter